VGDRRFVWATALFQDGKRRISAVTARVPALRISLEYTFEIALPKWLRDPPAGYVTALCEGAPV
jgi:hypothetical protein